MYAQYSKMHRLSDYLYLELPILPKLVHKPFLVHINIKNIHVMSWMQ